MRSLTYKSKQGLTIKSITQPCEQPNVGGYSVVEVTKLEEQVTGVIDVLEGKNQEASKTCSIFLLPFNKPHLKTDRDCRIIDILHKYKSSQTKKTSNKYARTHFSHEHHNHSNLCGARTLINPSKHKQRSISHKVKPRQTGDCLEKLRMDNEANLMSSIEGLRKLERGCLRIQKEENLSLQSINLSRNSTPSSLPRESSLRSKQLDSSQFTNSPNMAQLREKIKLKLSRRHIYHALRNKSEQLAKMRLTNPQPYRRIHISQGSPVLRGSPHRGSPHFSAHPHTHLSFNQLSVSPCAPHPEPILTVDSRQAQMQHLRHSKYAQITGDSPQTIFNTFLDYTQNKETLGQRSKNMLPNRATLRQAKRRGSDSHSWKRSDVPKGKVMAAYPQGRNIFRELTPWRSEDVE